MDWPDDEQRIDDIGANGNTGEHYGPPYTLIYADPPWNYRDRANDGRRGASHKYPVMNVRDICRLPVHTLAAESCLLAMWWVGPQPMEALKVIEAWGFRLSTFKGFTWGKTYPKQTDKHTMGMGHLTRANSEDMLFAVKGKLPPRLNAGITQLQIYPRMAHSAKPPQFRDHLVELLGDVPRIELFARDSAPGWDHWGNELDTPIQLTAGGFYRNS